MAPRGFAAAFQRSYRPVKHKLAATTMQRFFGSCPNLEDDLLDPSQASGEAGWGK